MGENRETLTVSENIIRVGLVDIAKDKSLAGEGPMVLTVLKVKDYDGKDLWMPVLTEGEAGLGDILDKTSIQNSLSMPRAGELTMEQREQIGDLIRNKKMPWFLAIHACLNGGQELDLIDRQDDKVPVVVTISGKPGIGKSVVMANAADWPDLKVWLVNGDMWARSGTRATDYLEVINGEQSLFDRIDTIGANRPVSAEGGRFPTGTVRQLFDEMIYRLNQEKDQPDAILLDTSGNDGQRPFQIQDLIRYMTYQPVGVDHENIAWLSVALTNQLKVVPDIQGLAEKAILKAIKA